MYIKTATKTRVTRSEIKRNHLNTSLPREIPVGWLTKNGYAPLIETPEPATDEGFKAVPDGVEEVEGQWRTKWAVVELTAEEKSAIIQQRLADTDKDMARIAEEVIGIFVAKNLLTVEEMPDAVKAKIAERAALREQL
jgi:hypothetical protein